MTQFDDDLWPARLPSPGFAASTVEHMLRSQPQRSKLRLRGWVGLASAALFISSAAYAWSTRHHRAPDAQASPVGVVWAVSITSISQRVPRIDVSRMQAPHALSAERGVPSRAPAKVTVAPAPTVTVAPLPSLRPAVPKVPPCGCQRGFSDFICDCY